MEYIALMFSLDLFIDRTKQNTVQIYRLKMTQFALTTTKLISRKVTKKPITYLASFEHPEIETENMPFWEKCKIESTHQLNFYDVPCGGDEIELYGSIWECTKRKHYPYEPYSREPKRVSEIFFKWVSNIHESEEIETS